MVCSGVWSMRKGKGGKRKKGGKGKLPAAGFASLMLQPELNEERLSHLRELKNFKIRGSSGQKAPL